MKILITGAKGFIGKNLAESLKNIRDGKDRTAAVTIDAVFEADADTAEAALSNYCRQADFVFCLAGVNRPKEAAEFMQGNRDALGHLLALLRQHGNTCPVMYASSIQAALDNDYGRSKRAGEQLLFDYAGQTGAKALVYRFPNVFGKWCRPDYNSAVATFCHHIANGLPITVNDESTQLSLVYIDDVVKELTAALSGRAHRDGDYCTVPTVHRVTLGEIVRLLRQFNGFADTLTIPPLPPDSFEKKLYSAFLSYLPKERLAVELERHADARGSFTELLRLTNGGQFSVNVSKPGITKGEHWHHTKWEFFIVVYGQARIQQRRIGSDEVITLTVSGEKPQAVYMLPGYTHNITNLSDTQELITLMWANEHFDAQAPDTYFEPVE